MTSRFFGPAASAARFSSVASVASLVLACLISCGGADVEAVAPPAPPPLPPAASVAPPAAGARPAWASEYPATRSDDTKDTLFGIEVKDPYRWLEDAKSAEVQAWVKAEDDLTRAKLAALPDREAIAARLKELAYVDSQTTPIWRGSRLFYGRRSGAQEKTVIYWREGKKGEERVLLDPNTWSQDGSSSIRDWDVSWDGKRIAYTVSEKNSDEATMHVAEVATAKVSAIDVIPGAKYASAAWNHKGDGFYYVRLPVDASIPTDQRPGYAEIRYHTLGVGPANDELVHDKTGDPTTFANVRTSKDGRWLFYAVSHGSRAIDVYFRDLSKPPKPRRGRRSPSAGMHVSKSPIAEGSSTFGRTTVRPSGTSWRSTPLTPIEARGRSSFPSGATQAFRSSRSSGGRWRSTTSRTSSLASRSAN